MIRRPGRGSTGTGWHQSPVTARLRARGTARSGRAVPPTVYSRYSRRTAAACAAGTDNGGLCA